ncbi:GNAT family N-acetyltransferase [Shewanella inventionis]|uniref:N-acetyltransferase GCN5 n=1 Tax=Shewanella inventionis TaxID=1738770 RepID=A0ABQ1IYU9_9GAMM|nr:GNAT family N-acetyltransferase [Shewanella inventionis]MCL1156932.1 GNAT family N-acetyltransferase [Shewanella inventionis]UAL43096.1 GNAT family N-acetyltransferase [Shewanella inventionis]GGB53870.1 N-acetyltransferase GCN5 [Shewanella inventionis]
MDIYLKDVCEHDLERLFAFQYDPIANKMADVPSREREAFYQHWQQNIFANKHSLAKGIWQNNLLVGHLVSWVNADLTTPNEPEIRLIGYWIGREYWGKGIATQALALFLKQSITGPVFAYIDGQNQGSLRVAQANGFVNVTAQYPSLYIKESLLIFKRDSVKS